MKFFFGIFLIAYLSSCNTRQQIFEYDEFNLDDSLVRKRAIVQVKNHLHDNEYELIITKNDIEEKTVRIKEQDDKIYLKCGERYICSHSLNYKDKVTSCVEFPPVLNQQIRLIDSKTYMINGNKINIFSYNENSMTDRGIITFFEKNIGFLCYYDLNTKKYYFLSDKSKIHNSKFKLLNSIQSKLINDTTYFPKYTLKVSELRNFDN